MKRFFTICLIFIIPLMNQAQSTDSLKNGNFGISLNNSFNGELYTLQLIPTLTYSKGLHQFDVGVGFNPFDRMDQTIVTTMITYKHFPNGMDNKFNLYLISQISHLYNKRNTYYPSTYHYIFVQGGYGFLIRVSDHFFLGTDISIDTFTFNKNSKNPYDGFASISFLDEFGFNLSTQFHMAFQF